MKSFELCCQCDEPTGRAGPGDGSLYMDDGRGPFCETCYEKEHMNDDEFRAFLDLMMCADPWPVTDTGNGTGHEALLALVERESDKRGFKDWIDAFHEFGRAKNGAPATE